MREMSIEELYRKNPCKMGFARVLYSVTKYEGFNSENVDTSMTAYFKDNISKQFAALSPEQKKIEISLEDVLNSNGVEDAYWALRCWEYKDYCLLLANVAESVLHIYEEKNNSKAPREAIEAIRKYRNNEIAKKELKSYAAAAGYAAAADGYAVAVAAAAGYAADGYAADGYAVAVAGYAAAAAGYAAADAGYAEQWERNEQLMIDFIKK